MIGNVLNFALFFVLLNRFDDGNNIESSENIRGIVLCIISVLLYSFYEYT